MWKTHDGLLIVANFNPGQIGEVQIEVLKTGLPFGRAAFFY